MHVMHPKGGGCPGGSHCTGLAQPQNKKKKKKEKTTPFRREKSPGSSWSRASLWAQPYQGANERQYWRADVIWSTKWSNKALLAHADTAAVMMPTVQIH